MDYSTASYHSTRATAKDFALGFAAAAAVLATLFGLVEFSGLFFLTLG